MESSHEKKTKKADIVQGGEGSIQYEFYASSMSINGLMSNLFAKSFVISKVHHQQSVKDATVTQLRYLPS